MVGVAPCRNFHVHFQYMRPAIRARASRALLTSCGCTTTAVSRRGVVHHDAENAQTRHALDVLTRRWRRRRRSLAARREDDLLRLVAVEREIIRRRPRLQVFNLLLAGGRVAARNDQILCVIGELEYPVSHVNRLEISGRDDIRRWSQRRTLYDAGIDSVNGRNETGVPT